VTGTYERSRTDRESGRATGKWIWIRRAVAAGWAVISVLVAYLAGIQFAVTFAPPHPGERGLEEVRLMYRVTGMFAPLACVASVMLAVNAIVVVWLAWNRPREN